MIQYIIIGFVILAAVLIGAAVVLTILSGAFN